MSKRFALVSVLLIAAMLVSGCGQKTVAPTTAPVQPTTAPAQPTAVPAPTDTPKPAPTATPVQPKKLVWGVSMGTNCLDPAFQTGLPDSNNLVNIYNGVVTHKPGSLTEVDPDLAERWTVSADGLVYTFYLRSGVQWQGGYGEFTAEDVKYSWDRMLNPETKTTGATVLKVISSIEVVDKYTVRVTLKAPNPPFLINIANTVGALIVNKKAIEERGTEYCLKPIGTGPYQVSKAETNGTVVLQVFDKYFGAKPAIDEVEMRVIPEESVAVMALKSGEIDYAIVREPINIASLLKAAPEVVVNGDQQYTASTYALWLNNTRKPFDDVRVRRALTHAIDRDTLAREATEGLATKRADSPVPPSLLGYTEDVTKYDYDPEKAKALLAEAGYPNGFKITVDSMNTAFNPVMLTIVQSYWKKVGVDLEISYLDRAAIRQHQAEGSYDITVSNPTRAEVGLILDYYKCGNFPPGPNFNLYKAPDDICKLMIDQATEIDQQKRVEMVTKIQQQITNDCPNVLLWYVAEVTAARSYVKGMIPNLPSWQTRFYYFDIVK